MPIILTSICAKGIHFVSHDNYADRDRREETDQEQEKTIDKQKTAFANSSRQIDRLSYNRARKAIVYHQSSETIRPNDERK